MEDSMKIKLTPEELDVLRHALKVEISSFEAEELDDPDLKALCSLIRKLDPAESRHRIQIVEAMR
jgi:non-homologous end joining protein Ku